MMTIELLGDNCQMCHLLEKNILLALEDSRVDATYQHVGEPERMAEYGLLSLPGVAIDGKILSVGQLLSIQAIKEMLAP